MGLTRVNELIIIFVIYNENIKELRVNQMDGAWAEQHYPAYDLQWYHSLRGAPAHAGRNRCAPG